MTSILLVVNETQLAEDLSAALDDMGYKINGTFNSIDKAISILKSHDADLIILEQDLPSQNQSSRSARFHELEDYGIPILRLTEDLSNPQEGSNSNGNSWHLTKTFTHPDLKSAIELACYQHNSERKLIEIKNKYQFLIEQSPAITYTAAIDSESTTLYVSPQVEFLLGFTPDEYAADPDIWRKQIHPADRDRVMAELSHSHNTGKLFNSEYRMLAKDESLVWFHDKAKIILDEKGNPSCVQGVMLNITDKKLAERALTDSEQKFQTVFNTAAVGMDILDKSGRFIEVNPALTEMLGYTRQELLKISPLNLTHPEDLQESKKCLDNLVQGRTNSYRFQKRYLKKDNTVLFADVMVSKILKTDGTYENTIGVISDITEHKKVEFALKEKTHDLDERIKELNCLFGISQLNEQKNLTLEDTFQQVVSIIPPALQFPEDACACIHWKEKDFKSREIVHAVSRLRENIIAEGATCGHLEVAYINETELKQEAAFLKEEEKLIKAISERLGKMIERVNAQTSLKRHKDRLEQLVKEKTKDLLQANEQLQHEIEEKELAEDELKVSAATLEASNQDLAQFAFVAAHDLRSPLISLTANLKMLERLNKNNLDEESIRYLREAIDSSMRMDNLIRSLLDYSLLECDDSSSELTDLNIIVEDTLVHLRTVIEKSGARIKHGKLPTVIANPSQMLQLFLNLISNAIKFQSASAPEIVVDVEEFADHFKFFIEDNGIGIPESHSGQIFRIFQRLKTERNVEGNGIGLANCKKIVDRHGGSIWVESNVGEGATFYFTIPKTTVNPF